MVSSTCRLLASCVLWLAGCSAISGLDEFKLSPQKPAAQSGSGTSQCSSHADCKGRQSNGFAADFCSHVDHRCVALRSAECGRVTGPADDERAVLLGSLFATSGAQGKVNVAREQSAMLAVDEINASGGLPAAGGNGDKPRPIVLVSCDASQAPLRAAEHLVNELHVPAIVGPNNSQNTLDIAQKVSIPGGTLTLSPTAVAASIADLRDDDLAWQLVPHDAQRGPLLVHEIGETERALRAQRGRDLKLAVIVRDDALGDGTRASLADLTWNGARLADAVNLGVSAKIDTYPDAGGEQTQLVQKHLEYAPDVVVLVGAGEALSGIMAPLERGWKQGPRPEYLVIDSSRVPELLSLAEEIPDLARRVRGTGITPSTQAQPVNQAFLVNYSARYPDTDQVTSSGVGPSYDATYALAYALAAAQGGTTGRDVARGLRLLSGGDEIQIGPAQILAAFRRLAVGQPIDAVGTYSRLAWDDRGAISAGTLEIWCVELLDGMAVFTSSGLTADIPSQVLHGENEHCAVGRAGAQTMTSTGASLPSKPGAAGAPAPTRQPPVAAGAGGMAGAGGNVRGSAGAGGRRTASGAAGAAGSSTTSVPAQPIPCGPTQCQRSKGEYCCISQLRPVNFAEDYSCETAPRDCASTLRCTSDRECDHGAICCLSPQRESYCSAAGSCRPMEMHLGCDDPTDCGDGERCCGHGSDPAALMATSCAASCQEVAQDSLEYCSRQSQCDTPNGCQWKPFLGSVGLCL